MSWCRGIILLAIVAAMLSCSASRPLLRKAPPAPLVDASAVLVWEGLARPDFLHTIAVVVAIVEGNRSDCPRVERDGALTTITGGCTDGSGTLRTGRARILTTEGETRVRLHDFGDGDTRVTGRASLTTEAGPRFELDLRVDSEAPMTDLAPGSTWLAIDAHGHVDAQGRWHAEARLAAEGRGSVRTRSADLELDKERCAHEPWSGRTELWSGEHHVEIRYDGETDCNPEGTARWWRNGVEQGELRGIQGHAGCSAVPGHGIDLRSALLMLLLVGPRRRRTSPQTT